MKNRSRFSYQEADKWFVLNDKDDYLTPIYISLPKPPKTELIDGYGLPPEEQVFKRLEVPKKLISLEKGVIDDLSKKSNESSAFNITGYKIIKEFWIRYQQHSSELKKETEWIKRFWWHKLHGYWFFCNGKPTYITGWHFSYLNDWYMPDVKGNYPHYRDRDRRWFLGVRYFYTTQETFAELDENNKAIKGNDGRYLMLDTGRDLFLGVENTKHRRSGETNKSLTCCKSLMEEGLKRYSSITSYTKDHAEGSFKSMLIPAWQKSPIWFKHIFSNSNDPTELNLTSPSNVFNEQPINARFDYANTAEGSYYDGKKINGGIVCDEEGKTKLDVSKRWDVILDSLTNGSTRVGFSFHPSTVEEIDDKNGSHFEKMMEMGDFYTRKSNGETMNRLARMFFRSSDGREGYVDKFGNSVEFSVTDQQKEEGFKMGAYEEVMTQINDLEKIGTPDAIERARAIRRKHPLQYMDSFIGESGAMGWDIKKIDTAIKRIKLTHKPKRYDLIRNAGTGLVEPKENVDGRFTLDLLLPPGMASRKITSQEYDEVTKSFVDTYVPEYPGKFLLAVDPIGITNQSQKYLDDHQSKFSKAGAEVFWTNDTRDEGSDNKNNFHGITGIAHYLYRCADMAEYVNDMVMLAEYYGALICPESNKATFIGEMLKSPYRGYLYYEVDPITRKKKAMPGVYTGTNKKEMLLYVNDYIGNRYEYDSNLEFWSQAKKMRSLEEMTSYDMVATYAVGLWGLLGLKGGYLTYMESNSSSSLDVESFFGSVFF